MEVMKRNIEDYEDQLVKIFGSKNNISDIRWTISGRDRIDMSLLLLKESDALSARITCNERKKNFYHLFPNLIPRLASRECHLESRQTV
jgi:hypothetical protein